MACIHYTKGEGTRMMATATITSIDQGGNNYYLDYYSA